MVTKVFQTYIECLLHTEHYNFCTLLFLSYRYPTVGTITFSLHFTDEETSARSGLTHLFHFKACTSHCCLYYTHIILWPQRF